MNELELKLKSQIKQAINTAFAADVTDDQFDVETPKDPTNGDFSTNAAMKLARVLHNNPRTIAATLTATLNQVVEGVDKIEIAGPGFINFWMKKGVLGDIISTIIDQQEKFGQNDSGAHYPVLVEYVSANPTGPLHAGHARGAVWGDAITRLMKASGYDVLREYYINDAGHQIDMLGESLYARYLEHFGKDFTLPQDGYHGQDVKETCEQIIAEVGDKYLYTSKEEAIDFLKWEGRNRKLEVIKQDLAYYGCQFDSWVSEKWITEQGRIEAALQKMTEMGLVYEADNAIWFKSTEYGDDKDRVLRKSDGFYTYLTPDIANHEYKFERGYKLLVDLWGADHHGYIPRMRAALTALGHDPNAFQVDIIQMVRLVRNGEEVKMSKRTGNALTIRELIDDIGVDAARYFFISRPVDTHMDLDLDFAKSQTQDNPVYYAQYAYARMCSILRQGEKPVKQDSYALLSDPKEIELLKQINDFPSVVADAARTRQPNMLCNYIQKMAASFHSFYGSCRVNDPDNPELTGQRTALVEAVRITLKNALDLIGINAPEKM